MKAQKQMVLAFLAFCIMAVIFCILPIKIVGCLWTAVGLIYLLIVIKYETNERAETINQD